MTVRVAVPVSAAVSLSATGAVSWAVTGTMAVPLAAAVAGTVSLAATGPGAPVAVTRVRTVPLANAQARAVRRRLAMTGALPGNASGTRPVLMPATRARAAPLPTLGNGTRPRPSTTAVSAHRAVHTAAGTMAGTMLRTAAEPGSMTRPRARGVSPPHARPRARNVIPIHARPPS